ncbi:glycosyltransferase family protein [Dermabacteraceae bacterium P13147]
MNGSPQLAGARPGMVFYAPYPIQENGTSGSAIRPRQMLRAFHELGYEVVEVTGDSAQRLRRTRKLRERLATGWRPVFAYCENASIPALLTDPRHLPRRPWADREFFRLLRTARIPSGYFYRDCYWVFPRYLEAVGRGVGTLMRALYRSELRFLARHLQRIYLPSMKMARYLPQLPEKACRALPPGAPEVEVALPETPGLTVLYVGGIGEYYDIGEFLRAVQATDGVRAIVCTREKDWRDNSWRYGPLEPEKVRVVHASGEELKALYAQADACSLLMGSDVYRDFAAPVKLFEYIGYGRPVLASEGTHAAEVVASLGAGLSLPNRAVDISRALVRLRDDRAARNSLAEAARRARSDNTWLARAAYVARDLAGEGEK